MGGIDVMINHACRVKTGQSVLALMQVVAQGGFPVKPVAGLGEAAVGTLLAEEPAPVPPAPAEPVGRCFPAAWVRECKSCVAAPAGQTLGCGAHVDWPLSAALEHAFWVAGRRALAGELPADYGPWAARFARAALRRRRTPWANQARKSGLLELAEPRGAAHWPWQRLSTPSSGQLVEHYLANPRLHGEQLWQQAGFTLALVALGERLAESARQEDQLEALAHALEPWRRVGDLLWLAAREGMEVHLRQALSVRA